MLKCFAEKKNVSSFGSAKAQQKLLTFFSAENIRILYIESAKTVNEMTLNDALNNWALNNKIPTTVNPPLASQEMFPQDHSTP